MATAYPPTYVVQALRKTDLAAKLTWTRPWFQVGGDSCVYMTMLTN